MRHLKKTEAPFESIRENMPFSLEAECGVLGCMLIAPKYAPDILPKLPIEAFYNSANRTLYSVFIEILNLGKPLDHIVLIQTLTDKQLLEETGGQGYLAQIIADVPTPANYLSYTKIILEKYHLRQLKQTCAEAIESITEGEPCEEILVKTQAQFLDLTKTNSATQPQLLRELTGEALVAIDNMFQNKGQPTGLPTGIDGLDKITSGFGPGEMIVFAARPGCGKSSLALNIADYVAIELKKGVLFFTLEMPKGQCVLRLISSRAEVNFKTIQEGWLHDIEWKRINAAVQDLEAAPFRIHEAFSHTITQIRLIARSVHQEAPLSLIVIDYIGLLEASTRGRHSNRESEISEISRGIKAMALELKVTVISLCQLNREGGRSEQPKLHHLRDSGSIEQDADMVIMIHHQSFDDPKEHSNTTTLSIQKNRRGPTGQVEVEFANRWTKFRSPKKEAK